LHLPLVSIIIPVFNAEKYLEATLRSVIGQTWPNKEIILVDDGSTDSSLLIAKTFECSFIKVYSQINSGASAARNKGMAEAKGEFLQFLDADDLLAPDKISRQLSLVCHHQDTLAICPVIHFNNDQEHSLTSLYPNAYELGFYTDSKQPFEFLLRLYGVKNNEGSMIPVHSWLTPTSVVKKAGFWNEELSLNDDGEFFSRVVINSLAIINAPDTFCYYRKAPLGASLSSRKDYNAFKSQIKSISLIQKQLKNYLQDDRINLVISRMMMELLVQVYPQYKKLAHDIAQSINEAGGTKHRPIIGGKLIELIKTIFGWKCAKTIQHYYRQIKK